MPKKIKSKIKKKISKKIKTNFKKQTSIDVEHKELVFKTKPEWLKSALVNKTKYQRKYSDSIKNNNEF